MANRPSTSSYFVEESATMTLKPVSPLNVGRYAVVHQAELKDRVVPAGFGSSATSGCPSYLPSYWSLSVHPEGKRYYFRNSGLRVITEEDLTDSDALQSVTRCITAVEAEVKNQNLTLAETVELYVQPDYSSDDICWYYLVDHAAQMPFWLEEVDTDELGLQESGSESHMKLQLEWCYWTHTESFCNHINLPERSLNELIAVYSHGLADMLTAEHSTFPYDAKMNKEILPLLQSMRGQLSQGQNVCAVARFWVVICRHRFETHFGELSARLSRDSKILVEEHEKNKFFNPIVSVLTLGIAAQYYRELDNIFVDHLTYTPHWHNFMQATMGKWQREILISAGLLLLHYGCALLPVYLPLAIFSASLAMLGLTTGAALVHRHEHLQNVTSDDAFDYVYQTRSNRFGLQGLAFAYSLPKTFIFWSLMALAAQWLYVLCQIISPIYLAFIISAIASIFSAIYYPVRLQHIIPDSFKDFYRLLTSGISLWDQVEDSAVV
ncbi:hypothetical protein D9619_008020 [Psilocybe cf. subviscida]|uniref:Uncharacterized protein n=1 Tax=Psilocybe cf. subviscida TaxID=2480587 RepID=A0A8H5AVC9_9AGAR|nr:hypothetical protein D9619_008020 [Psilocybe cf. subviscida]